MDIKKFKILAASDIHGDSKLTKNLAEKAESYSVDLVVLCGDLFGFQETSNLIKPFKNKNKPVLLVPGNWDSMASTDLIASHYGFKNIHGYSAIYKDIGFFGAGGAEGPGPSRISESDLLKTIEKAHSNLEKNPKVKRKIMITHMHPSNTKSEFSGIPGSKSILHALKKFSPNIVLHGHIHEAAGFEDQIDSTRIINVGREGVIIEL